MGYNSWPEASMEERPQESGTGDGFTNKYIMIEDECNNSPQCRLENGYMQM